MNPRTRPLEMAGLAVWLTAVWLALWGEVTPANVASGLVTAVAALWLFPFGEASPVAVRPLSLLRFGLALAWSLMRSTAEVAALVVLPRLRLRQGVVAVPLRTRTPAVVAVLANSVSLTPGTLVVDIDDDDRTLFVHAIRYTDEADVRRRVEHLERLAQRALSPERALPSAEPEATT